MNELVMIAMMSLGGLLFSLGGTTNKLWRRYALPICLSIGLIALGCNWILSLLVCTCLSAALHLGYGEKHSYLSKFLTGCLWVIPSTFIGWTEWQVITPVLWIMMFWLSNNWLQKAFSWKYCEFLSGVLISITYINSIKGI